MFQAREIGQACARNRPPRYIQTPLYVKLQLCTYAYIFVFEYSVIRIFPYSSIRVLAYSFCRRIGRRVVTPATWSSPSLSHKIGRRYPSVALATSPDFRIRNLAGASAQQKARRTVRCDGLRCGVLGFLRCPASSLPTLASHPEQCKRNLQLSLDFSNRS